MKAYAIADWTGSASRDLIERVERLAAAGADLIQLRGRDKDDAGLLETTEQSAMKLRSRSQLLVSRRADVAAIAGADGVHLPAAGIPVEAVRRVAPHRMVGRSCHSLEDCRRASDEQPDYLLIGPVFDVRSKQKKAAWSLAEVEQACRFGPEVFVIGGMTRSRIREFAGRGIAGIAGITLFMQDEPVEEIIAEVHAW